MKKVQLLDVCTPDYFTGYHSPVASVLVNGTMTNREVAEGIEQELDTYLFDCGISQFDISLYQVLIDQLMETPDAIYIEGEECAEDMEDCMYMYFGVTNIKNVNGLCFLS